MEENPCPVCWALLVKGLGFLLRKTKGEKSSAPAKAVAFCSAKLKEENPLLLQRQSHFPSENKEENPLLANGLAFSFGKLKED